MTDPLTERRESGITPLIHLLIIAFLLISLLAWGKTYPIVEPDALTEFQERAGGYLANADNETRKAIERFKAKSGYKLTKAPDNYSYPVGITYTLDKDIAEVDIKGVVKRIFYSAGYTFNPLDFLKVIHPTYIAYNHCDKAERNYVSEYIKTHKAHIILLSSGCPISELTPITDHSVYPLPNEIAKLYKLKHTISIVTPNNNDDDNERRLEVNVISIK
jgi:hypothetical protein